MSIILLLGLLFIVLIGIPIGVGFLLYFIPKRLGHPRVAKYLTTIYGLVVVVIALMVIFEDQLFTKNDAKKLIGEQNIILNDKFVLDHNESSSRIRYYYHAFTLIISEHDKQNAITNIKKATGFKTIGQPITDFRFTDWYDKSKHIQNYETEDGYVREYFEHRRKIQITINKVGNNLIFEDQD